MREQTVTNQQGRPSTPIMSGVLQRKCACGNHAMGGECEECGKKNHLGLQTKLKIDEPRGIYEQEAYRIADQVVATSEHSENNHALPLEPMAWKDIERRFDYDFPRVRAHTSTAAEQSARDKNAHAYAMTGEPGSDMSDSTAVMPGQASAPVPTSGELPGSPGACVVQSAMPYSRSGIIRTSTGDVYENFEVRVEWSSANYRGETSYCAAECGEYHQFVKGYARSSSNKDGSGLTDVSSKVFGGKPLDQNKFQEDGLDKNPNARYGHRKEKQTMNEKYEPDRATGAKYVGYDSPGVFIGAFADFDLTFVGKLVDTCQGTETLSEPWRVAYRGVIRP
jgi:hypothetical protein